MGSILFKNRDGQTPLEEEHKRGIKVKGINTSGDLDIVEENNIALGLAWLEEQNSDCIDCLFWKRLHRELFKDVWDWAGKFRSHELMNDEFDPPGMINERIKQLESDLSYWLENQTYDSKEIMARFHLEFLTIHPFTNGNGRAGRILAEHICKMKGLPEPTWGSSLRGDSKKHRDTYLLAIEQARNESDFTSLIKFIFE